MDTCTAQLLHSVMDRGSVDSDQLLQICRNISIPQPVVDPRDQPPPNHGGGPPGDVTHTHSPPSMALVPPASSPDPMPSMTTLSNMALVYPPPGALGPGAGHGGVVKEEVMERYSPGGGADTKKMRKVGQCKVCGDEASGMYFGAMVCVPCKTFFLRYYGDNFSFVCRNQKNCEINMKTRTQCKYCRMQKCLQVGMLRRVRPSQVQISDGQQLCVVCSDLANGLHFGAITCEGCKKFFRRGLKEHPSYVCKNEKNCLINPRTRNACRYCRYQKCLKAGMCREAIQMGRPSKFRHIVHNPHLPVPKPDPSVSPENMHPHPGMAAMGHGGLGRGDPRDYGHYGHPSMYMGDNMGHMGHSPHAGHTSPPLAHAQQASNHLYQALKGNPASQRLTPEMHSPINHQSAIHDAIQIKSEPPDHGYNQLSPPQGYHSPIPQPTISPLPVPQAMPQDHQATHAHVHNQVNILNITNPWSQAMKTMNQETNMLISNSLMSDENNGGYGNHYPKYTTAGQTATETTRSMNSSLPSTAAGGASACSMAASQSGVQSTYSTSMEPQVHAMETHALTSEDLELLENLHRVLETANPQPNPDGQAVEQGVGEQQAGSYGAGANGGQGIIEAMKAALPTVTSHQPSTVATESINSFNNFMELSTNQLTEWIDFLKRERESSISPNNTTLKALSNKNSHEFNPDYWLKPILPDENIFFTEKHRQVLDQITTAYTTFVENGHKINQELTYEFYKWLRDEGYSSPDDSALVEVDDRFNSRVVEKYTICSVIYCKSLPGFRTFAEEDQYNIVRLGQSQSRILAAASHWYRREKNDFDFFLSWKPANAVREYKFKESCLKFSEMIAAQDWDMIESAIMNSLVMVATDYSGLKSPDSIESIRLHILQAFRAYTTAKYGTPNTRIEELFSAIPRLRELGVLHHKWTMVHLLKQESKEAAASLGQGQVHSPPMGYQGQQGQLPVQGQGQMSPDQSLLT